MAHPLLGHTVHYTPHAEHEHLAEHGTLAAIVGRVQDDGRADLFVLVPHAAPIWMADVAEGEGPHTWRHKPPQAAETPPAPQA